MIGAGVGSLGLLFEGGGRGRPRSDRRALVC